MNTLFFYIRDESKFPVACVATIQMKDMVVYAYSVWNPKDKFSKERARSIAEGRLYKSLAIGSKTSTRWVTAGPGAQDRIIWDLFSVKNNPSKLLREALSHQIAESEIKNFWESYNDDYFQPTRVPTHSATDERDVPDVSVEGRADGANGNGSKEPIPDGDECHVDLSTARVPDICLKRYLDDIALINREDPTGTSNATPETHSSPPNGQ